ncbi:MULTISPECIES: hypothetical protein [unclassified Streptomyces]|uniref:hypothetical protein n=1 Tax=unclassified Streptomyces TaxID=2593676 RepID=UPI0005A94391|nr:hypothetical protein [Streptomyces sp. NBRC 110035]
MLRAREFVHQVHGSRIGMPVTEAGRTGWNTGYALTRALRYELGMADGTANGVFGPGTRTGLKDHTVPVGTTGTRALLLTAAVRPRCAPGTKAGPGAGALVDMGPAPSST